MNFHNVVTTVLIILVFFPEGILHVDIPTYGSTDLTDTIEIEFNSSKYVVDLKRNTGLFHSEFQIIENGRNVTSMNSEFIGRVREPADGIAVLSRFDDYRYIGAIFFDKYTFYIEPAHYNDGEQYPSGLVGRLRIDLNYAHENGMNKIDTVLTKKVEFRRIGPFPAYHPKKDEPEIPSIPNKTKNRCPVVVIVDFALYSTLAKQNFSIAASYAINQLARLNFLLTRVNWDEGYEKNIENRGKFQNMGISIKKVIVLTKPDERENHYNSASNKEWDMDELLENFSDIERENEACLVTLMTSREVKQSSSKVCGASYKAEKNETRSGICSNDTLFKTLFTTTACKRSFQLLTEMMDLVTGHEYGHAFGSGHDQESQRDYIMNAFLPQESKIKNLHYSSQSKSNISKIMENRWESCFEEEAIAVCGNKMIEGAEECDSGNRIHGDSCCHANCTLRRNASCSFVNHICCDEYCQFRSSTYACLEGNDQHCHERSNCSGTSGECPPPPPSKNGSECFGSGICVDGECLHKCSDAFANTCLCEYDYTKAVLMISVIVFSIICALFFMKLKIPYWFTNIYIFIMRFFGREAVPMDSTEEKH